MALVFWEEIFQTLRGDDPTRPGSKNFGPEPSQVEQLFINQKFLHK